MIKTVNAVILDEQNRILLVKRAMNQTEGGMWSLPGGTVEPTETLNQTLERELLEEINCRLASPAIFLTHMTQQNKNKIVEADYFVGHITGTVKLDLNELSDFAWFMPKNLPSVLAYKQEAVLQYYLNSTKQTKKS